MKSTILIGISVGILALAAVEAGAGVGTAFIYQGRLTDNGGPANQSYDLEFRLYDSTGPGGNQKGPTVPREDWPVVNGLFTVSLDFGLMAFNGDPRWLEVRVRPANSQPADPFTTLSPRQPVTPAPYAMYADTAGTASSVPWSALTGVPAGLADGDNDTTYSAGAGLSLNGANQFSVQFGGDGLESTAARSDHVHYGQVWGGSAGEGLRIVTSSAMGRGVFGWATSPSGATVGVIGESASPSGRGVSGFATASSGGGVGVYGESTSGNGMFGRARASAGNAHGVLGVAESPTGVAVCGNATALSGQAIGVLGEASGPSGRGVFGLARATSGLAYGVYGTSVSTDGQGVYGLARAITGTTYGVYGESFSPSGRGIFGTVSALSGENFGVRGETASTDGTGVYGLATATSGEADGVVGITASTGGRGVDGTATATSGVTHGVRGRASSTSGYGVHGIASAASGTTYGVSGTAASPAGYGVYGANASGVAIKAAGSGIIQSSADSHVFVPGNAIVKAASSDSTRWVMQVNGSAQIYRGATAGGKTVFLPIPLRAVLYGQPVTVENITVYYRCQSGPNNFIAGTILNKQTDADSSVSLVSDLTFRASNTASSYTLTPAANNVMSSSEGILSLNLNFTFVNDTEYIQLGGVRVQFKHE